MKKIINHQSKIINITKGFGLLEVVISIGILALVSGSAITMGKIALRNNMIANQRSQVYNLVRAEAEALKAIRDSKWIDQKVNFWNEEFIDCLGVDKNCSVTEENNNLRIASSKKEIILDEVKFNVKANFSYIDESLNGEFKNILGDQLFNSADNLVMITANITVEWQSYGKNHLVKSSFNLSDWKPQI